MSPDTERAPWLRYPCPECRTRSLFVDDGNGITCGNLSCANPLAASEILAAAAALDGAERRCVKCGGSDLWTNWHRDRWDCSYSNSRHGDPSKWAELTGEHLHRGCRRCRFTWRDPVLIPRPDKETTDD